MVQPHYSGRERLMLAADSCFRSAPYASVGVASVLDAAGVKAPSLYHHFGDKEGLFVEWVEGAFAQLAFQVDPSSMSGARQELEAFCRHMLERVSFDVPQKVRDVASLERQDSQERVVTAYSVSVYEPLCSIFLNGIDRGQVRLEPITKLADALLAGCWTLHFPPGEEAEAARWWVRLFLHGVGTGM